MADVPNNNTPALILDEALSGLLKALETAGVTAAETALPPLAFPVVKQIFEAIADQLELDIALWMEAQGTYLVIKLEVWGETNGANDAIRAYVAAYKNQSMAGLTAAATALIDADRKAGQWDGTAKPVG